jgi:hypothetical protein
MTSIDPDETEWMIAICGRLIALYLLQEAMMEPYGEAGRSLRAEIDELLRDVVTICPRSIKGSTLLV